MSRVIPNALTVRLVSLCRLYLRDVAGWASDGTTGEPILDFDPPLTAGEQTTYADLLALARSGYDLTLAEYQAIKPFLATGRTFLALSQSDFIALTQNARDRMLFDNVSAQWRVILRLLRDG